MVPGDHDHPDTGAVALGNGLGHIGAQWVLQRNQAEEFKIKVMLTSRQFGGVKRGLRHAQHAQPSSCHGGNLPCNGVGMLSPQVAQIHNGLRSTLGRDEALAPIR